jgi:hypothetical protein
MRLVNNSNNYAHIKINTKDLESVLERIGQSQIMSEFSRNVRNMYHILCLLFI